jgi:hypothetical protein
MPYFECLHCGTVALVEATPPKCTRCGHGTGIIHQNQPRAERSAPQDQQNKKETGESGGEPSAASAPSPA